MIFIVLLCLLSLMIAIDTARLGVSPMPSSRKAQKILLSLVQQGVVYELGSGWGTLAISLSKKTTVRAFEAALIPWAFSLFQKSVRRAKNLSVERKDFFSQDLSNADVIICYLYPGAMKKLLPKLEKELKQGAIVLSNSFQLPGKKADQIIEVQDWTRSQIYLYLRN